MARPAIPCLAPVVCEPPARDPRSPRPSRGVGSVAVLYPHRPVAHEKLYSTVKNQSSWARDLRAREPCPISFFFQSLHTIVTVTGMIGTAHPVAGSLSIAKRKRWRAVVSDRPAGNAVGRVGGQPRATERGRNPDVACRLAVSNGRLKNASARIGSQPRPIVRAGDRPRAWSVVSDGWLGKARVPVTPRRARRTVGEGESPRDARPPPTI
jgi:hypothetical protein